MLIEAQKPEEGGLDDIDIFSQPSLDPIKIDTTGLVVKSNTFLLASKVIFLEREYYLNTVIRRDAGAAVVIARSQSHL